MCDGMARDNPSDLILIRAERDSMQNEESDRETRAAERARKPRRAVPRKKCDDLGRKRGLVVCALTG